MRFFLWDCCCGGRWCSSCCVQIGSGYAVVAHVVVANFIDIDVGMAGVVDVNVVQLLFRLMLL